MGGRVTIGVTVGLGLLLFSRGLWASGGGDELQPGLYAEITASRGRMVFELDYQETPLTTANFAGLATGLLENTAVPRGTPYYDGTIVYRRTPRYAVFLGDPLGEGTGGPGYTLPSESGGRFSSAEAGVLMMDGLSGESSGSRFFITLAGDPFLDSKYTGFGRIVSGVSVLKRLRPGDVVESVRILQIGEEAEALRVDSQILSRMTASARRAEIGELRKVDPGLGDAVEALGEERKKTPAGIYYSTLQEGAGENPEAGDRVSMHYTGMFVDGTIFDSSRTQGQTFDFVLGRDGVIPGWIEMVIGMKSGEIRRAVIPPGMAYGEQGFGPIGPNAWLIFDMELVGFTEG